jgi:sugar phosphate isomerase/epimerase
MRLAFSTLACPEWPLDRVLAAAAEYGYEGVELRILDGELVSPSMSAARRRDVRSAFERSGVVLCGIDTSFEIANPAEDVDEAMAYVELAADLGAPMIRLFGGAPDGEPFEATATRTVERLVKLAERGGVAGVTVALETHDTFASGEATERVLRDAPRDIGVIWDTLNTVVAGEPPEVTFERVAGRLVHVHVKDGGVAGEPERNRLYGEGVVPLPAILGMMSSHRYDGWLSVEWEKRWQPSIEPAEVALPSYADGLRATLRGITLGG